MLGIIAFIVVLVTTARWFWLVFKVNVPERPTYYALAWTVGAVLGAVAVVAKSGTVYALIALALGAMLAFLSSTSAQRVGERPIAVGDRLPSFTAIDENGEIFDSQSLLGTPAIIKFFRGHW